MLYLIVLLIIIFTLFLGITIWKKCDGPVRWIYFEIIYNCFIKFLIGYLKFPSICNYFTDIILIVILLYYVKYKAEGKNISIPNSMKLFAGIYFGVTIISFLVNRYSLLLYLFGFRNNMRFILFAMMCAAFLSRKDVWSLFDILFGYYLLNILAVTYEFFFAGLVFHKGDCISGLYSIGNQNGGNDALNWLLCIVSVAAIVRYLHKEKSIHYMLFCIASAIYMAVLSELKFFFIELIIISVITVFICRKSFRMLIYLGVCTAAVVIGIQMLYCYFPQFNHFFTLETMKTYLGAEKGYRGAGSINRLTAISYVFSNFLKTVPQKIIGIGFGNAEYSGFSFLTSSFYLEYSWTAYQWFYIPFVLIETGILGTISFLTIFGNYLRKSLVMFRISAVKQRADAKADTCQCIAVILCMLSFPVLFYDQSLKLEASGYLVHALLCIPYIMEKQQYSETADLSFMKTELDSVMKKIQMNLCTIQRFFRR